VSLVIELIIYHISNCYKRSLHSQTNSCLRCVAQLCIMCEVLAAPKLGAWEICDPGGRKFPHEKIGDARRKISIKPLKENNPGVARAFLKDTYKIIRIHKFLTLQDDFIPQRSAKFLQVVFLKHIIK